MSIAHIDATRDGTYTLISTERDGGVSRTQMEGTRGSTHKLANAMRNGDVRRIQQKGKKVALTS